MSIVVDHEADQGYEAQDQAELLRRAFTENVSIGEIDITFEVLDAAAGEVLAQPSDGPIANSRAFEARSIRDIEKTNALLQIERHLMEHLPVIEQSHGWGLHKAVGLHYQPDEGEMDFHTDNFESHRPEIIDVAAIVTLRGSGQFTYAPPSISFGYQAEQHPELIETHPVDAGTMVTLLNSELDREHRPLVHAAGHTGPHGRIGVIYLFRTELVDEKGATIDFDDARDIVLGAVADPATPTEHPSLTETSN